MVDANHPHPPPAGQPAASCGRNPLGQRAFDGACHGCSRLHPASVTPRIPSRLAIGNCDACSRQTIATRADACLRSRHEASEAEDACAQAPSGEDSRIAWRRKPWHARWCLCLGESLWLTCKDVVQWVCAYHGVHRAKVAGWSSAVHGRRVDLDDGPLGKRGLPGPGERRRSSNSEERR